MKIHLAAAIALALALAGTASAQNPSPDSGSAPPAGQASGGQNSAGQGSGNQGSGDQGPGGQGPGGQGGGYGRRGGRGGFGGGMGMMGRGLSGTVTAVAADHYTVKSFGGDTYTVNYSANTRIMKQAAGTRGEGRQQNGQQGGQEAGQGDAGDGQGRRQGRGYGGNPPEPIKATDVKVGDAISSMGEVDATAKSVGATTIMLLDPERARQMQEAEANFGKTWLMGKVTAIDGVKVTLAGAMDNAPHSFVADENTTFRRRRDPITLADIQVGDTVRADGALKDGVFTATTVGDMGSMQAPNPRGSGGGPSPASPQ